MTQSNEEGLILEFLKQEALQGHFESTTREIANGTGLGYNRVGRVLERLLMREVVKLRERKRVHFHYLKDVLETYQEKQKIRKSE